MLTPDNLTRAVTVADGLSKGSLERIQTQLEGVSKEDRDAMIWIAFEEISRDCFSASPPCLQDVLYFICIYTRPYSELQRLL